MVFVYGSSAQIRRGRLPRRLALLDEDGRPFAQDLSAGRRTPARQHGNHASDTEVMRERASELNPMFDRDDTSVSNVEDGITAVRRGKTMRRRSTVFLVALQCVVAYGYAVSAQDAAQRPSYASSSAARTANAPRATTTVAVKPRDPLTLQVSPRFSNAPAVVRSRVHVAPNTENRVLRLSVDSERYYRSSDIYLDGDLAAESHWLDWKSLPAGRYEFVATVLGPTGPRIQRRMTFEVLGLGTDAQP